MLRAIAHTPISFLNPSFYLPPFITRIGCGIFSGFSLEQSRGFRKSICRNRGNVADILEILDSLDVLLSSDAFVYSTRLKKCFRSKSFVMVRLAHAHLVKLGFKSNLLISNILLNVYSKAGFLDDAAKFFDEMPHRDLISWCTLISGYVSYEFDLEAYCLFRRMLGSGLEPNHFVMSSVLKSCSAAHILELGVLVHCRAMKCGLGFDSFVEVGLVGMYAKCGVLNDALKVFYEIPVKDIISWNTIISGCIHNGCFVEAAQLCLEMCRIGFRMDLVTLRIVMNVGSALKLFNFCKSLYVYSIKIGMEMDCSLVTEFVRLLANIGEVDYMTDLFSMVKKPDVSLFVLLISGYQAHGYREKAMLLVEELLFSSMKLKEGAWICMLNVCESKEEGMQIHPLILKVGYLSSINVENALISMYIRCGKINEAYKTFVKMEEHDVVSWTAIMAGLIHNFHYKKTLEIFHDFNKTKLQADKHCVATAMNACAGLLAIDEGKQIHALAVKQGVDFSDFLSVSIAHMYTKCGYIGSAEKLFSLASSTCKLIMINIMLAGYCRNSFPHEAFELFRREYRSGLIIDHFSISIMLGACADLRLMMAGRQIHCLVVKAGFEFSDTVIQNAIVNMYTKSGHIASACQFYYSMKRKSIILYGILMLGYLDQWKSNNVLKPFSQLRQKILCGNSETFARSLRCSEDLTNISLPKQIHRLSMNSDNFLGTSDPHVDLFANSNLSESKREVSHYTLGDYITFDSTIIECQQYGEEKRHFVSLDLFKQELTTQSCYIYADDIVFYENIVSRMGEASPMPSPAQNCFTVVRPIESQRLIVAPKSSSLAP